MTASSPSRTTEEANATPGSRTAVIARRRRGPDRESPVTANSVSSQLELAQVDLENLCAELGPGARLPLHTELMARFGVSERAILRAMEELQREGRIVRRRKLGTIVAELRDSAQLPEAPGDTTSTEVSGSDVWSPGALLGGGLPVSGKFAVTSPTWSIVAVAQADHSFYERCLDQLCAYADDSDLSVFCKPLRIGEKPTVERLGAMSLDPAVCRFVFFGFPLASIALQMQNRGARVVLVGTPLVGVAPEIPCVYGNQDYGGYMITRKLIETGHRNISFFHDGSDTLKSLRWQGHQRALREARRHGIAVTDRLDLDLLGIWEADPSLAADYFRGENVPDALIAWNDREAIRTLAVLQRAGIRVPEDVTVTGYDNLPEGAITNPPLMTIDPGTDHQLRAAVDILSEPEAPEGSRTSIVIPTLVERDAVAQRPPRAVPAT